MVVVVLFLLLLLRGGGGSLSEYNLAAYCIQDFGFMNSLRGGILNSIGFYLTLVLRILFGVGSSSFDEVIFNFFINKFSPPLHQILFFINAAGL